MNSYEKHYQRLYNFQDQVLKEIQNCDTEFYLTGGTALSRCYLDHRYSDDLDFFVNFSPSFNKQSDKIKQRLMTHFGGRFKIQIDQDYIKRFFIIGESDGPGLKLEFINDVPARVGEVMSHSLFPRIDHWKNILANKITALSRNEPKDWVDILFLSYRYSFNWIEMIEYAKEKDTWVEEVKVASYLNDIEYITDVKFKEKQDMNKLLIDLDIISKDILKGADNSLVGN